MNQKGNFNFLIIGIIFLTMVIIGSLSYFFNQGKQRESDNQNQEQNNNSFDKIYNQQTLSEEEINNLSGKKMTNEQAKAFFAATEIVSNDLPESIEFWTEAYCPGSETEYDYNFDNIYACFYSFDSCEQGKTGSHGGCETCIMSKIKLNGSYFADSSFCENNSMNYYQFNNRKIFVEIDYLEDNCTACKIRIYNKSGNQDIKNDRCLFVDFFDINFDNYYDLLIQENAATNATYSVYLFDPEKDQYLYNENFSKLCFSRAEFDETKKELYEYIKIGFPCEVNAYKIENNIPILIETFTVEECRGI